VNQFNLKTLFTIVTAFAIGLTVGIAVSKPWSVSVYVGGESVTTEFRAEAMPIPLSNVTPLFN
jgi:hypothetical protein